jgi:allantoin racemase
MKIKVIIPNSGMDRETLDSREKMLKAACRETTVVSVDCIEKGPESIESAYDEALAVPEVLRLGVQAEKDGFDAIVVYCGSDPGVDALREMVCIPVIAPGRASVFLASYLSSRFSYITVLEQSIPRTRDHILEMGIEPHLLASVRSVEIPVSSMRDDLDFTLKKLAGAGRAAVEEDGAECLVLGCLGMAGLGDRLQKMLGIPVIDPAFAAMAYAEMLSILGLCHSKNRYPFPPDKVRIC